jgi:hypothetical protein
MSFAALRQTVLQAHALSTDYFAEDVEIDGEDGAPRAVRVKIEHEQMGPSSSNRTSSRKLGDERDRGTFDERERIRVLVSRDPTQAKSYTGRPQPGASLSRSQARDPDRRPFVFLGEVVYEGDQHAVYVFERPRRIAQGRGI